MKTKPASTRFKTPDGVIRSRKGNSKHTWTHGIMTRREDIPGCPWMLWCCATSLEEAEEKAARMRTWLGGEIIVVAAIE